MEREESKFTGADLSDVEFRPRSYRGPSHPERRSSNDGFAWKIGVSVGIAVLVALLIFNAYERHLKKGSENISGKGVRFFF